MSDLLQQGPSDDGDDPEGTARRPWYRRRRFVVAAAAVVVVVAVLAVAGLRAAPSDPSPTARAARSPVASPVRSATLVETGSPLLPDAPASWRLYARMDGGPAGGEVAAIRPGTGAVQRTPVPRLRSDGPVFFVVGRAGVLVRPLDDVPGYGVAADGPAYRLHGLLSRGGPLFPGPSAGWLWVPDPGGNERTDLALLGPGYAPIGPRLHVASGVLGGIPDGAGGLLYTTQRGLVDTVPGAAPHRLTGTVLATGAPGWLLRRCSGSERGERRGERRGEHCRLWYEDRRTGHDRSLVRVGKPRLPPALVPIGTVSPDGRTAAVLSDLDGFPASLHLIDLRTGRATDTGVTVPRDDPYGGRFVWSPDGRWLFTVRADGRIVAVDHRTGLPRVVAAFLPPVSQIAFRDLAAPKP